MKIRAASASKNQTELTSEFSLQLNSTFVRRMKDLEKTANMN